MLYCADPRWEKDRTVDEAEQPNELQLKIVINEAPRLCFEALFFKSIVSFAKNILCGS